MSLIFTEMIGLLIKQKGIQEELLGLSYKKRQVIIGGSIEELNEIVAQEQRGIARLNQIDKKRKATLPALSGALGLPESELSLTLLIEHTEGELKEQLLNLRKELLKLMESQAEINKINQELLETQIEFTETQLNLFVGAEDPINNLYGGDGKSDDERRRSAGIFDKQI